MVFGYSFFSIWFLYLVPGTNRDCIGLATGTQLPHHYPNLNCSLTTSLFKCLKTFVLFVDTQPIKQLPQLSKTPALFGSIFPTVYPLPLSQTLRLLFFSAVPWPPGTAVLTCRPFFLLQTLQILYPPRYLFPPLSVIPRSGPSQIPHFFSHFPYTLNLSSCTTHQLSSTLTYTQMPKCESNSFRQPLGEHPRSTPSLFIAPYLRLTLGASSPSSYSRPP